VSIVLNTIIGIALGLLGALINNFGVVLQKRQVNKRVEKVNDHQITDLKQYFKDPLWVLSFLMQTILYLPFVVLSLDYLGITLGQPIANGGVIFLVLGLIVILGEKLQNRTEGIGFLVLIFGVIIIAFGGVVGDVTINIFFTYLGNFLIQMLIMLSIGVCCLVMVIKVKRGRPIFLGIMAGTTYAFVTISLQIFTSALAEITHPWSVALMILGFSGAVIGTFIALFITQETFKKHQAIYLVPFSQMAMNLLAIMAGLFVFQQVITFPIFFWMGVISIIGGATLLARYIADSPVDNEMEN